MFFLCENTCRSLEVSAPRDSDLNLLAPRCQQWLYLPPYLSMFLPPSLVCNKFLALWWASNTKVFSLATTFKKVPGTGGVCSVLTLEFRRSTAGRRLVVVSPVPRSGALRALGAPLPSPPEGSMHKRRNIFTWMATIVYFEVGCRRWSMEAAASVWPLNPDLGAFWGPSLSLSFFFFPLKVIHEVLNLCSEDLKTDILSFYFFNVF